MSADHAVAVRLPRRRLVHPRTVPRIIGTACALVGLVDVAAGVFPGFRHSRMHVVAGVFPGAVTSLAAAASVVTGILILMLAHALKRGKRRAWRATVVLLPVSAGAAVLHRHSVGGALLALGLLALLVTHRREFTAKADPRTRWQGLAALLGLSALGLGLGLVIVSAHPESVMGDPGWGARLREALYGLFGLQGPVSYATDQASDVVAYTLGGLGFLTAFTTVYLVLRPARPVAELTPRTRAACGSCWPGTAPATRWATSRCAGTRASSSRPAARPPSATAWCPV